MGKTNKGVRVLKGGKYLKFVSIFMNIYHVWGREWEWGYDWGWNGEGEEEGKTEKGAIRPSFLMLFHKMARKVNKSVPKRHLS